MMIYFIMDKCVRQYLLIIISFLFIALVTGCSSVKENSTIVSGSQSENTSTESDSETDVKKHNVTEFVRLPLNTNIADFVVSRTSTGKLFCVTHDSPFKLFISEDNGEIWKEIESSLFEGGYPSISISNVDDRILFITSSESIYKSVDGGYNWISVSKIGYLRDWRSISINGNTVISSRHDIYRQTTLFKSIDLGNTWTDISPYDTSLPFGMIIDDLDSSNIYASGHTGSGYSGIYVSNDGGQSFSIINPCRNPPPTPPGYEVCYAQYYSFFVDKDSGNVFAASNDGLYLSKNKGKEWAKISSITERNVSDIIVAKNIVFKSGVDLKISYDNMNSWEIVIVKYDDKLVEPRKLDFSGNFVYFSSYYGLYRAEIN